MDCSGYTAILHCTLCLAITSDIGTLLSIRTLARSTRVQQPRPQSSDTRTHIAGGTGYSRPRRRTAPRTAHRERDFGDLNAGSSRGLGRAGWLAGRRGQNGIFARQRWLG